MAQVSRESGLIHRYCVSILRVPRRDMADCDPLVGLLQTRLGSDDRLRPQQEPRCRCERKEWSYHARPLGGMVSLEEGRARSTGRKRHATFEPHV